MTATAKPEPFSRVSTEHYDRLEYHIHSKVVEFHISARLSSVQAAVNAALVEIRALGLDPDDVGITYRGAGAQGGVVTYEVERDDLNVAPPPADEDGFAGIVAFLPRDWPQQLRQAVNRAAIEPGRVEDVLKLVDGWVLAASE